MSAVPTEREPSLTAAPRPAESGSSNARGHGRRPALDGMRALAVTAVVVYHFGGGADSWLRGGFLGVDIFFVLSGYLITGLLLSEYARSGRIDVLGFWVRRLRRLAPALIVVLLAVCGWVWWATAPDAYPARRSDVFWTLGYLANWHLISTSETYFAAYTSASPLRHAWSLAVEEQFYLVWPTLVLALLWLGRRLNQGRRPVLVVAVVGAGASAWWMASAYSTLYPSKAYYATQGRVQELFVGVVLAVVIHRFSSGRRLAAARERVVGGVALVALVALVLGICFMPDDTALYYTGGALAVSIVAALVIAQLELQSEGGLARAFSWRPAVALGRISYGVYLWHWPVVVAVPVVPAMTLRQHIDRQLTRIVITLALSIASYFLVERPVQRSRRLLRSPGRVIVAALASSALVVAVAIPATALPGTLAQQVGKSSDRSCPGEKIDLLLVCTWPAGADPAVKPPRVMILGDSTARALSPGLDVWAEKTGSTWVEAAWKRCTATGLLIIPSGMTSADIPATTCHQQASAKIAAALREYRPNTVLVGEFWANYQPLLVDGRLLKPDTPEYTAALKAGYLKVVDEAAAVGSRVVFIELPPPGTSLGTVIATGRPAATARGGVPGQGKYVNSFNDILRSVAAARPEVASTVSITDVVCRDGVCGPLQDGIIVRYDGVHYSIPFSRRLVPVLMDRIGLSGPA